MYACFDRHSSQLSGVWVARESFWESPRDGARRRELEAKIIVYACFGVIVLVYDEVVSMLVLIVLVQAGKVVDRQTRNICWCCS